MAQGSGTEAEWSVDDLIGVAYWQKFIIYMIIAQVFLIGMMVLPFVLGPQWGSFHESVLGAVGLVVLILRIVVGVFSLYAVYKLGKALRQPLAILFALLMFVPLISLLTLAILSDSATKTLQRNGIEVKVFGAVQEDLDRMILQTAPSPLASFCKDAHQAIGGD